MKIKLINKEEFAALTPAQKRVAIAKDVLERIKLRLIIPYSGQFIKNKDNVVENNESECTPQEFFNQKSCEACAKGSIFDSWVGNFNKVSWESVQDIDQCIHNGSDYPKELLKVFGSTMLDNIEAAFEEAVYSWHQNKKQAEKFKYFFDQETDLDSEEKLTQIMGNIIKNNGKFIIG